MDKNIEKEIEQMILDDSAIITEKNKIVYQIIKFIRDNKEYDENCGSSSNEKIDLDELTDFIITKIIDY